MSNELMKYKGYFGSVNANLDEDFLWGKLEFIGATVTYEAETVKELAKAFHEAVDDYLATCEAEELVPEKPFKGSFNVRTKPEIHRDLFLAGVSSGMSLNETVNEAFRRYIASAKAG